VTTLIDEGDALVVRCDDCRRLWPISSERLQTAGWLHDSTQDTHTCPVCLTPALDADVTVSAR
jgi:hypothetical protein